MTVDADACVEQDDIPPRHAQEAMASATASSGISKTFKGLGGITKTFKGFDISSMEKTMKEKTKAASASLSSASATFSGKMSSIGSSLKKEAAEIMAVAKNQEAKRESGLSGEQMYSPSAAGAVPPPPVPKSNLPPPGPI